MSASELKIKREEGEGEEPSKKKLDVVGPPLFLSHELPQLAPARALLRTERDAKTVLTLRQNSVPSWLPHWPTWSVTISRGILIVFLFFFFFAIEEMKNSFFSLSTSSSTSSSSHFRPLSFASSTAIATISTRLSLFPSIANDASLYLLTKGKNRIRQKAETQNRPFSPFRPRPK